MNKKIINQNFKNNQNYIKSKNFDKYFFWSKISYYFLQNLLFSITVFSIIIIFFIILFKSNLFVNSGLIFGENLEYFYFNKKIVFFYLFIGIGCLFLILNKNKYLKEFIGINISKNLSSNKKFNLLKNWKIKIILLLVIILLLIFLIYLSGFGFAINIFLFGFFLLIFHFIFDIKEFSKEKVYIKKPILNYFKIITSIENNNIIIRNYKKNKSKNIFFLSIIYQIFLFSFILILFFTIIKPGFKNKTYYYFMSVNLNKLVEKDLLNLKNKNLGDESINNIFEYIENKNIKKLNIAGNNYNYFIHGKNKIDFIDYGNVENYYKNFNLEKIILSYNDIKEYYYKINFSENFKAKYLSLDYFKNINISEFYDKYNIFKKYYGIDTNKIKEIKIDFKISKNDYFYKGNFNINKKNEIISFIENNIETNLEKNKKNFLILLNNNKIFKKGFNVKIINAFTFSTLLKQKIDFFKKIENENINLIFEGEYGEYFNKYFELKYYSKRNNNKKINKITYENKNIKKIILENLIFRYRNLKNLELKNIKSDKNIVLDLEKTNIENFNLTGTKFKLIRNENIEKTKTILVDNKNFKQSGYSYDTNYIYYPDFIVNSELNKIAFGTKKNNLFNNSKYSLFHKNIKYGHYKFSRDFLNGLYLQNWNTHKTTDFFYAKYFENIFKNKKITDKNLDDFLKKYNSDKYFKKQIDFFIKINNVKVDGFYTGLTYKFDQKHKNKTLEKNEKIKLFFKYIINSEQFKIYLKDYRMFSNFNIKYWSAFENNSIQFYEYNKKREINFQEIFKIGNTYIFVKKGKNELYSCNKVSRVQTDFYDNPKKGKIKYIGKSGNFFYYAHRNNNSILKKVILDKNSFYANTFSNKYSHSYKYKDNGKIIAYRGNGQILINPGNKVIDTKGKRGITILGFYKKGFLYIQKNNSKSFKDQKSKIIYADLSGEKIILKTLFDYKYKYINQVIISKDLQHYVFSGKKDNKSDLIIDGKIVKTINGTIDDIQFYGEKNKIAFTYLKGTESGIYVDGNLYVKFTKNKLYSKIYSLEYIKSLDKFAFIVTLDYSKKLIIGKKEHNFILNSNSFGKIYIDNKNNFLYNSYGIKTTNPRKDGYKYGYLKLDLRTFERKDFKIYDGIKDTDISESGLFGFREKDGIYIDGEKIINSQNGEINGFSFGKEKNFYYTKYEEEKYKNQTLSFFYNYKCEKN